MANLKGLAEDLPADSYGVLERRPGTRSGPRPGSP